MRWASCSESLARCTKRSAVSCAFRAFLILLPHVLALADDRATSQHLIPRPSSSVTIRANALRSSSSVLIIVGFSIGEMADASPSKYSADLTLRTGLVGYLTTAQTEATPGVSED